jgi:leader peptidase (prepilin peptidase)/N-methyltransferase
MDLLVVLLAIPIGLVVGGFVTMIVDRIPDKTPLTLGSRCPVCEHPLSVRETVPVISWIVQRGACRHCSDRITPAYPFVELVTMALWVAVAARFGWEWTLLPPLVMVTALTALSVIDMYLYRLPDRLVFPALGVSAVAMVIAAFGIDYPESLTRAGVAMLVYGAMFFVLHLISPRGMGFGDVKLSLLLGLHLGWAAGSVWVDWIPVYRLVFYALLISCFIGGFGGLLLVVIRKRLSRDVLADPEAVDGQPARLLAQSMPFGPALATGTTIVVLFAESFV